jgi:hypothetical protein
MSVMKCIEGSRDKNRQLETLFWEFWHVNAIYACMQVWQHMFTWTAFCTPECLFVTYRNRKHMKLGTQTPLYLVLCKKDISSPTHSLSLSLSLSLPEMTPADWSPFWALTHSVTRKTSLCTKRLIEPFIHSFIHSSVTYSRLVPCQVESTEDRKHLHLLYHIPEFDFQVSSQARMLWFMIDYMYRYCAYREPGHSCVYEKHKNSK